MVHDEWSSNGELMQWLCGGGVFVGGQWWVLVLGSGIWSKFYGLCFDFSFKKKIKIKITNWCDEAKARV